MTRKEMNQLIIVPCHSIWRQSVTDSSSLNLGQLPEHWFLAPFQYEGDDHLAFIKHGLRAIQLVVNDPTDQSSVIFSGSQTKSQARCLSEAQSYYMLMHKLIETYLKDEQPFRVLFDDEILSYLNDIKSAILEGPVSMEELFVKFITTEEFALDSFENLLFSIYRFKQWTGNYPKSITIVGFGFKETRFLHHHAKAIDFPLQHISYISIDPVPTNYTAEQLSRYYDELRELETRNALQFFALDWYGEKATLRNKKVSRNPFKRRPGYQEESLFDLKNCGDDEEVFFNRYIKGLMPWSSPVDK